MKTIHPDQASLKSSPSFLLAIGLWLAGLAFSFMPLEAYEAHSFAAAFVLCGFAFLLLVLRGHVMQRIFFTHTKTIPLLALAFWGLAFFSVVASDVPTVSFLYFCFFSVFPLSFFTVLLLREDDAAVRVLLRGLYGVVFVLALTAFWQYFLMPDWLKKGRVSWPLADANALAGLYVLAFFAGLGLMLAAPSRFLSNTGLLLAFLCFCAMILTASRGAFVCLVPALGLFLWIAGPAFLGRHKRCLSILAGGCLLFVIFINLGAVPEGGTNTIAYIYGSVVRDVPVLWDRPALWLSTLSMWRDHLWTGTGIGTFFLYYPQYRGADYSTAGYMAHQDILQFGAEMGVAGPLLFYAFVIAAVMRTFKALKALDRDDMRRFYIAVPFCGFAALVAHAHFTFHFNVLPTLMVSGALLAFWYIWTARVLKDEKIQTDIQGQTPGDFLIVALFPALLFSFCFLQASEIFVHQARSKMARGDIQGFAGDVNTAGALSFGYNARALILAASVPMGILEQAGSDLPQEDVTQLYEQARALLKRAVSINPRLASVYYYEARLQKNAAPYLQQSDLSKHESSQLMLEQALRVDPYFLPARMMLSEIFEQAGNRTQAYLLMKPVLDWNFLSQDRLPSYERLARLALLEGDLQAHSDAMGKIAALKAGRFQPGSSDFRDIGNILP